VKTRTLLAFVLVAAMSGGLIAQSAQEAYQRGLVQEHAAGDLTRAIALYAEVVRTAGRDRALAAKALRRLAGCQEKMGQSAEAAEAYADLVRTYPEQRAEVAAARERLAALRRAPTAPAGSDALLPAERASDAELAVRLAAFLWSSVPDAALIDGARRGELRDRPSLTRHVRRMLDDARSVALVDRFFVPWLALDRLETARPDASAFPNVDRELLQAMGTETRLFLHSQLRHDRDAVELWTADYTYVNEPLARHYGMAGVSGKAFRRVAWPTENRRGLLGQAGPLTALSMPARTSPAARGLYLLTRFFGMDPPAPPANVPPLAEQPDIGATTLRERMQAHKTNPSCASCHAAFDPLGLALENFDATGAWRVADAGAPIDASGAFPDGTRFTGPAELRAGLLKYRDAYYAGVTRRLLAFALGRTGKTGRVYEFELPAVRAIVRDAAAHDYRWSALLAGIATSAPFQARYLVP
jgi:hypothetical protein